MVTRKTPTAHSFTTLCLTAAVLLAAAGLKAHQLMTQPTPEQDLLSSRWFLIPWIEVELALGLWLLTGLARRAAWGAAIACFGGFLLVTLYKALAGEASCGCFGVIEVNPWITFVLDLVILAALILFRPDFGTSQKTDHRRFRLTASASVFLAVGLPLAIMATTYKPAGLAKDGRILGNGRIVLLEPTQWMGSRCPLLTHIDISERLQKGRWTVVLYHHDCPHCEKRIPEFEREAHNRAGHIGNSKVAMVELPPYAPPGKSLLSPHTSCLTGRVSNARDWFVETPTILTLLNGVVVDAKEGDDNGDNEPSRLAGLTPTPGERIVPFQPGGFDFGFVEPRSVHKVLLSIPNTTAKSLTITKVRAECACMFAVASDKPVTPGAMLPVRIVLVAPPKGLPYHKRVLLQTNDPTAPLIVIPIEASIGLPLVIDPSLVDAGTLALGEERELSVILTNRDHKPIRLLYSTSSDSGCFARIPREPIPPQGHLAIPIIARAQSLGLQNVSVNIQTDSKFQTSVAIPLRFTVSEHGGVKDAVANKDRMTSRSKGVSP